MVSLLMIFSLLVSPGPLAPCDLSASHMDFCLCGALLTGHWWLACFMTAPMFSFLQPAQATLDKTTLHISRKPLNSLSLDVMLLYISSSGRENTHTHTEQRQGQKQRQREKSLSLHLASMTVFFS